MIGDVSFQGLSHADNIALNNHIRAMQRRIHDRQERPHRVLAREANAGVTSAPATISVVPVVGRIVVRWSPVNRAHLYRVEYSDDNQFANAASRLVSDTSICLEDLDPESTYYVRVQALARGASPSPFSAVVNTKTGLAATSHLDFQAATDMYRSKITLFDPSLVITGPNLGERGDYEFPEKLTTRGGVLWPFVNLETRISIFTLPTTAASAKVSLLVDGEEAQSLVSSFRGDAEPVGAGPEVPQVLGGLGFPLVLDAGTYRMGVRVEDVTGPVIVFLWEVEMVMARLEVLELLR